MQTTVHVPDDFEHLSLLEFQAHKQGLFLEYLTNSKSFRLKGSEASLAGFSAYAKRFEANGVAVLGNDNFKVAHSRITSVSPADSPAVSTSFTPVDIAKVYGLTATPSSRVNIAIIELGGGYLQSDLTAYWASLGLTTIPNVTAVSVDGAQNTPGSGADYEVALDIEVIGGICPNSNIFVYFTPNTNSGFYDAINQAFTNTTNPASIISISWGSGENYWSSSALQSYNALFQKAAQAGVTICVASGDGSASDREASGLHVDFPASSPWVLACGGTSLVCPDRNYSSSTTSETVWGTGSATASGGGGGFSTVFARPSYQTSATASYATPGRAVPDVCGDADPATGWTIYIRGASMVIGGTSAVAPLWAGILGSINYNKFLNTVLYSGWQANNALLHDITSGSQGFSAGVGWDPASGLGSPNGSLLLPFLTGGTPVPPPAPPPTQTNVVTLNTMADYTSSIAQNKAIIEYCATWCGACEQAAPTYAALSLQYPGIKFCYIDIQNTNFSSLLKQYQVNAFPTFMYFYQGAVEDTQVGANAYLSTTKTAHLNGLP